MRHAVYPGLVAFGMAVALVCHLTGVPSWLVSTVVVGAIAAVLAAAERLAPDRADCVDLDQPFASELVHVFTGWLIGYGLGVWLSDVWGRALSGALGSEVWPSGWPMIAQVALACVIAEGTSYWQHRLFHRHPSLWAFHKLHHQGSHLNIVKSARFHFADIGVAALFEYLPLVAIGCPPVVLAWLSAITGAMGLVQHANVRMPAPRWMAAVLVTPAIHRAHHSRDARASDANFGTIFTVFDRAFGTYRAPGAEWPASVGVAGDELAPTLREQLWPLSSREGLSPLPTPAAHPPRA